MKLSRAFLQFIIQGRHVFINMFLFQHERTVFVLSNNKILLHLKP